MAPISLSHWDCAPGAGAEDCINNVRRLWRAELGSLPRRHPTRRRASTAPLFLADGQRRSLVPVALLVVAEAPADHLQDFHALTIQPLVTRLVLFVRALVVRTREGPLSTG